MARYRVQLAVPGLVVDETVELSPSDMQTWIDLAAVAPIREAMDPFRPYEQESKQLEVTAL